MLNEVYGIGTPVKFVEYCSFNRQKISSFDNEDIAQQSEDLESKGKRLEGDLKWNSTPSNFFVGLMYIIIII